MSELTARFDLPLGVRAPGAARTLVRDMLVAWDLPDTGWLDDAELLVSELVSNAVRHGGGCIELSVQSHEQGVTIKAADGSSVVPRRRDPGDDGGFGLQIIEAISEGWGVEEFQGGKRVWVRLGACPPAVAF
ncbi:MAG: ATP-binding protein [Hamadaea sp.]|uniref:ATP-binding protein n=1 Tax=Hamadaea sp. NPDC050747 TaxID=3155789 RepID=UPI0017A18DED|nr:ATP-binding protein [Hamadaea sp.]NUR48581.1 ATP-binding protein [Hamadaea sp.]NUT08013.1 ATP-binding protein [Hamadaea sp.]